VLPELFPDERELCSQPLELEVALPVSGRPLAWVRLDAEQLIAPCQRFGDTGESGLPIGSLPRLTFVATPDLVE